MSDLKRANEEIAEAVTGGFQKIEDGVVDGYKKIESTVVGAYQSIEDKFVARYLLHEGETVEQAKERLAHPEDRAPGSAEGRGGKTCRGADNTD